MKSRRKQGTPSRPALVAAEPHTASPLAIPDPSLVVLIGATGSGKSTFAARHFPPTAILNSDYYRGVVSDDPTDQGATKPAFEALHFLAGLRLRLGKLTVVDATSVKPQDRAPLVRLAREHDLLPVAVVLDMPVDLCIERNAARPGGAPGPHVARHHVTQLRRGLHNLEREGFRYVHIVRTPAEVEAARVERTPLWTNRSTEHGPFDIIGDVHGCHDELCEMLERLGYQHDDVAGYRHPDARRAIFLGDLVDRGPRIVETVHLARRMLLAGQALAVPGNHDEKLVRWARGAKVKVSHGLAESIAQIEALPEDEREVWKGALRAFVDGLVSHLVLDDGSLVVAHAGMKEAYQGRASGRVRAFALFGETTGETDEFGLPVRVNWAADYRGRAAVVYGHTPVPEATWLNNTLNIDTGCVFGGSLTALRWPERELVHVPARAVYAEPVRRSATPGGSGASSGAPETLLRLDDVLGKQVVETRLRGAVVIEADQAAAALEIMSRYALDPRWLIYLPPTMSPAEASDEPGWLEHPDEAFAFYRKHGVRLVVCEEKHMGSRAVLVLCRDAAVARRRFGVPEDEPPGACYTRTGRRFFEDDALNCELIERLVRALGRDGFWERHATDWVCLDAEILPWNAKAQGLLREQYAPVAAAGQAALAAALGATQAALARGAPVAALDERLRERHADIERYANAYRAYCWDVQGLEGVRVVPFHVLAVEGHVYADQEHQWHMAELARLAEADAIVLATRYELVELDDPAACTRATARWMELTGNGGEGIVVKPPTFVTQSAGGLVQPAIKCRGREYLRIIYGPTYTEAQNLARLRQRSLGMKRSLALREFALGLEALERFVQREPLWRVHQAVFGVLALESEPVDPRL
jgi:protein phosphatase